jgi:hypothetical protein
MDADQLTLEARKYNLEKWKTLISVLTPLALVALTFVVNSAIQERGEALKRQGQILAEKQKIYADLGKNLNIIYIYIADIGDFRSYTPPRVVELKRESDRWFFTYRPYWSKETEQKYNTFMTAAFTTYNGAGKPAKINAKKLQKTEAYNVDKLQWDGSWDAYFKEDSADPNIATKYYDLVGSILDDTVTGDVRKL